MNDKYGSIICNLNTSIQKNLSVTFNSWFLDQTDSYNISSGGVVIKGGLGISKNVNIGEFLTVMNNSNITGNLNVTDNINVSGGVNIGNLQLNSGNIKNTSGTISLDGNINISGNLRFDNINSNSPLIEVGNNATYAYGINIGGFDGATKADRSVIQSSNNLHLDAPTGNNVFLQFYNKGKTITQNIQCNNIYGGEATGELEIHTSAATPTYTTGSTDRNFRYRILDTGTSEGSGLVIDTVPTQSTLADSTSTAYRNEQLTFRYYSGGNMLNLGSIGGDWGPSYGNEGNLVFKTCGANNGSGNSGRLMERMRINADGDVGIGTSNPQSALQVIGIKAASPSSRGIHLGEDSLDGNQSIELCADTGRFCYLDFTKINTDYRFRIITDLINKTMTFHSVSNPLNFIQINNIGHLKVGQYFELGASSPNYMGVLGFNRDVSSGEIFNSSYNAYQIHNFNGLLQFEAFNNSGEFIGLPINISGDYVGMGQSPNYKLDVLHTTSSSGYSTATMNSIFQTTTGAGKHGIAIGGDVYTGNGYLQSVFNDTSTGYNILLQPIAGNVGIGINAGSAFQISKGANTRASIDGYNVYWNADHTNGSTNGSLFYGCQYNGTFIGYIFQATTSSIAINYSSDYRVKENIKPMPNMIEKIKKLNPIQFNYLNDKQDSLGFIAHEFQDIFPNNAIVRGKKDAMMMICSKCNKCSSDCECEESECECKPDYQGIDYALITPILVKGIQELSVKNDNLQNDNTELNSKYNNLEVLYDNLQSKYNDLLNRVLILEGN